MDRATREILELSRSVLGKLDLDEVLKQALTAAHELTDARYAALGVLNESKTELARFLTVGIDDATREAIGALPHGRGVLGALIDHPSPLRVDDVGRHPLSYGFPVAHPPMRSFLGVPILVAGEPYGNLYLTEKEGGAQFSEADEQAVVVFAEFASIAIDHARRYTSASESSVHLARTNAALEATIQIAQALGGETDLDVVLELVAKRGRALVSARALVIELSRGEQLLVAAAAGELPADLIGERLAAAADSLAGYAIRTGSTQRLEEGLNRARFREHGLGRLGVDAACGLVVPLSFRGESHGVLVALDRLPGGQAFSSDDQRLLEAFATSAATAVATARAVSSERQRQRLAAAEGERQRWARDLHDETLQSLSALRVGLSTARRAEQAETLQQAVGQAIDGLQEAIANLRALITDLRPVALDELGTQAAIEALAERSARHGIEVDVSVELAYEQGAQPARHLPELETALYRIVQEALTNAAKHGNARRAVVEVREDAGGVHLSVRDDGDGFDPDASRRGFGLLGIEERVALLEGEMEIESAPGHGAVVRARIPAQRRADDAPSHAGGRA
jgi:two-component system, NarL family, sensor histidine kinase DevS